MKKIKVKAGIVFLCSLLTFCGLNVYAATLMTWNGSGILGKDSIQSFVGTGGTVSINNSITASSQGDGCIHARLTLHNKNTLSISYMSMDQYVRNQGWAYTTSKGVAYKIYFQSLSDRCGYTNRLDMNGYVSG